MNAIQATRWFKWEHLDLLVLFEAEHCECAAVPSKQVPLRERDGIVP
jgi:hypothetical protein